MFVQLPQIGQAARENLHSVGKAGPLDRGLCALGNEVVDFSVFELVHLAGLEDRG